MLLNQPCAFVDIETTGTHANSESITEIGLRLIDTTGEVISWQQLLNPGRSIPGFIQELTGISNQLVADKPFFEDIAPELFELLDSAIFVAHNARFDYSFIKKGLQRCGYNFKPNIICTVKLSRALYAEHKRHNLDTICQRIGYHRDQSHRAMADVDAMLAFVSYAVNDRGLELVNRAAQAQLKRPSQPTHIPYEVIDSLPNTPGVYRFYDADDRLLYVGKSVRLRERVKSHFSSDLVNSKEMKLSQEVRSIDHTKTHGELGALLLENQEIKTLLPIYNRRQRVHRNLWSFEIDKQKRNGDQSFALLPKLISKPTRIDTEAGQSPQRNIFSHKPLYGLFTSKGAADKWYRETIVNHRLCKKLLGLEKANAACFNHQINRCDGVCVGKESIANHNKKIIKAFSKNTIPAWPFDSAAVIIEEKVTAAFVDDPVSSEEAHNYSPVYHIIDQWIYFGTTQSVSQINATIDSAENLTFDRETYRLLNRYIHLAKPVTEVLRDNELAHVD